MNYASIRIEGGILSPDIFDRLDDAIGQQPADFGLDSSVKVKDEIARAWADAQDYWRIFQRKLESLKAESPATTETRNNWIVPLLGLLGYQLEFQARGTELNGKNYPLSHRVINRGQTPAHIIGCREPSGLDRKPEKSALRMSAHAMVQEYLNLTDQLYGVVTNGRVLRLLRDSSRLIKLSYLEFDLDRIFADGLFADFAVLYRLLHASRLPQSAEAASSCWLERYHQDTIEQGTRIRDGLRVAVTEALELLGTGFISDPNNNALRQQIETKQLAPEDFFKHILRLVYRLLFLMVTEERGLVFPKGTPTNHINIYFQHYSVQRLRRLALTRGLKIERCHDAWLSLLSTFRLFEQPDTAAKLSMTALAGQLFHPESLGSLPGCRLSNAALFSALDRLCNFNHPKTGQRMPVNFGALATEEFGSVYESLLESHPIVETRPMPRFGFKQAAGNERKTTGSYYTPSSLVACLLDGALDPVLDERVRDFAKLDFKSAEDAILAIKVCDPACGSGHFLIAAAQRIARRLASIRSGDDEPSPMVMRHALRDVIGHCIYGVDINPMSVELCKVALWMEATEPGKPLSFLDHHIQCGNSLLGTTPALLAKGIPDDAFIAIEGDLKARVSDLKKENKRERQEYTRGQGYLFTPFFKLGNIAADFARLNTVPDGTPAEVAALQEQYARLIHSSDYESTRLLADTWCAAFVWKKDDSDLGMLCPTERDFRKVESHGGASLLPQVRAEIERLRDQYQFFHWHLAFPDVFRLPGKDETAENERTGWSGGFDVMLGNPPWEMPEVDDREFFASRFSQISAEPSAQKRRTLVKSLETQAPALYRQWQEHLRRYEGERTFFSLSGRYPCAGSGRLNYYKVFLEGSWHCTCRTGRLGMVIPSGLTTNAYERPLWHSFVKAQHVASVLDFENKLGLFASIDSRTKFSLLVLARATQPRFLTGCWLHSAEDSDNPERVMSLTVDDLARFSPEELALPQFRSQQDLDLLRYATVTYGTLSDHEDWSYTPRLMFSSSDAVFEPMDRETIETSTLTQLNRRITASGETLVPVYEGKMVGILDHRQADIYINPKNAARPAQERTIPDEVKSEPSRFATPQFWLREEAVRQRRFGKSQADWELVFCDVTSATNERTALSCIIPLSGLTRNLPAIYLQTASAKDAALLVAILSTFVLDYFARLKVASNHLTQGILATLPIPRRDAIRDFAASRFGDRHWFEKRGLELSYTAWDIEPFARDVGFTGPPIPWSAARRQPIRAELDAAGFHLFGLDRDQVRYVMQTFPTVKDRDIEESGEYRTEDAVLRFFGAMESASRDKSIYRSPIEMMAVDAAGLSAPEMKD